jgi:soluble lytic murein transglycosylase-like protein
MIDARQCTLFAVQKGHTPESRGGTGTAFPALRKEGKVMVYLEEACPKRKFIRNSMGWFLALTLGLLVSISDLQLPAETDKGMHKLDHPVAGNALFAADVASDHAASEISDLSASVYVPQGEPEVLPFDQAIHEAAGRYDVDADLIQAIIMVESQFNPGAKSKKGAKGLMQLMPVTADALDVANIYNPEENVNAGVRHFRWLLDRFDGDLRRALAAYNAGVQNVLRYNGVPPYPETQAYVSKVLEYYAAIKADTFEFQ